MGFGVMIQIGISCLYGLGSNKPDACSVTPLSISIIHHDRSTSVLVIGTKDSSMSFSILCVSRTAQSREDEYGHQQNANAFSCLFHMIPPYVLLLFLCNDVY